MVSTSVCGIYVMEEEGKEAEVIKLKMGKGKESNGRGM